MCNCDNCNVSSEKPPVRKIAQLYSYEQHFLWFYSVVFVERHFTESVCVCRRRKSKVVSDKAAIVSVPEMKCCVFESM